MAPPDYIVRSQGTAIIWGESGASGVTATLSFDGLANGSARMGAAVDLGSNFEDEYYLYVSIETGTAPTAGTTFDVYLVYSHDNSVWPAKVSGSDASYTLGTSDANLKQAGAPAICLIATADANTVLTQSGVIVRPKARYVVPIADNNLGQAVRDETTATDNGSRIYFIPRSLVVID